MVTMIFPLSLIHICLGHPVSLRDVLGQQGVHLIAQNRHILRPGVGKAGLVDHLHRPVDDRLFDGLQAGLATHDELAEGPVSYTHLVR